MTALPHEEGEKFYLTRSQVEERRRRMDADPWLFVKWVCGHGEKAIERFHRPLVYMFAGTAVLLAASLDRYDSEVVTQIKAELVRRGIDWHTRQGIASLRRLLRRLNDRVARSTSKTTGGLDAMLWIASRDPSVPCDLPVISGPDVRIGITSKSDPVAQDKFCVTLGSIMLSDAYQMYYPDRLFPKTPDKFINRAWIRMYGRTRPSDQETIEARGINSQWTSNHYDIIYADDIIGTESGEANQEDALGWLAAIHGISTAPGLGGSRHVFVGTIYGSKDDNAVLTLNPEFLSIRVPIWKKPVPANIQNIMVDGEPTIPEWYPVEAIRAMRSETVSNPKLGAIAWLQNFELTAHEEGALQFSAELLRRSKFLWVDKQIGVRDSQPVMRRYIRRYLWTSDGKPLIDTKKREEKEPCKCWMACESRNHGYFEFDPLASPRYIGVDQAFSLRGDKWSVAPGVIDAHGFAYALKCASGRGYRNMIPSIPVIFDRWGGRNNPPRKVGIESNAAQGVTADWIRRSDVFQFMARHIEPVSPGMTQKTVRIFNNVLANLEMGRLLLDPDDFDRDAEMLMYNAAEDDPEDNIIDSIAIMMVIAATRPNAEDESDARAYLRSVDARYTQDVDSITGVDVSDSFMDAMWT